MAKDNRFSIQKDILAGGWLVRRSFIDFIPFILYVFILIMSYMGFNQWIINVNRTKNRNNIEIKYLKADYASKAAVLQNQSSRSQIIDKLKAQGSTLKGPVAPAKTLKLNVDGKD